MRRRRLSLPLMLLLAIVGGATPLRAENAGFVDADGRQLVLQGRAFYVNGTNQYNLFYVSQSRVDEILADAAALGLNAIRTWAFCEGAGENGYCFQPSPGVYDEATFRKLDYVLYRANQLNLRVVLPLVNNWNDFGGMNQYLAWCNSTAGHDAFYTDACAKTLYRDYVRAVLTRVNTYTGVAYKDDPTILAWQLANEPDCVTDTTGDTLAAWLGEMAAFVKSIDANHLLGTGEAGWYVSKGGDWRHDGTKGADFIRNSQLPDIDVATFHLYPQAYGLTEAASLAWIDEHVADAHQVVHKPVLLGEFGWVVPRQVFGDFSTGTDAWVADWGMGPAQRVDSPSQNGNGAVSFTPSGGLPANGAAAVQRFVPGPMNAQPYTTLSAWVYVPPAAPADLRAVLYTKSGTDWIWREGSIRPLARGAWTQVPMSSAAIYQPDQLRAVGVKFFGGAAAYTGPVYVDAVTASTTLGGATMADRVRIYGDWHGRMHAQDLDAAFSWVLLGHEDDTSFAPDWDHFGIFHPEDTGTVSAIQAYSATVAAKNAPPSGTPPAMFVQAITLSIDVSGARRRALATVRIVDHLNNPVSGVRVYSHWTGAASDRDTGTTNSAGNALVASNFTSAASGTFTLTVDNVTKSSLPYTPTQNVESSDQISF